MAFKIRYQKQAIEDARKLKQEIVLTAYGHYDDK